MSTEKYGPISDCNKTGTIHRWPAYRNYGFIEQDDGNGDLFVHLKDVISNEKLNRGMRVRYDVCQESKTGKLRAVSVSAVKSNIHKETTQAPLVSATACGKEMQFKPPDGIEVDVIPVKQRGQALQGPATADGKRSVFFRDGTEYMIEIVNNKNMFVAVLVSVDGRKATRKPIIIRQKSKRIVRGFTLSRKSIATAEPSDNGRVDTETLIEKFIARRQDNGADSRDVVDMDIGEIRIEFLPVRFIYAPPGRHFNQLARTKPRTHRRGRDNVLETKGGKHHTHVGYHSTTNPRRPIYDRKKKPLGVSGWTIYDYDSYPKQSSVV